MEQLQFEKFDLSDYNLFSFEENQLDKDQTDVDDRRGDIPNEIIELIFTQIIDQCSLMTDSSENWEIFWNNDELELQKWEKLCFICGSDSQTFDFYQYIQESSSIVGCACQKCNFGYHKECLRLVNSNDILFIQVVSEKNTNIKYSIVNKQHVSFISNDQVLLTLEDLNQKFKLSENISTNKLDKINEPPPCTDTPKELLREHEFKQPQPVIIKQHQYKNWSYLYGLDNAYEEKVQVYQEADMLVVDVTVLNNNKFNDISNYIIDNIPQPYAEMQHCSTQHQMNLQQMKKSHSKIDRIMEKQRIRKSNLDQNYKYFTKKKQKLKLSWPLCQESKQKNRLDKIQNLNKEKNELSKEELIPDPVEVREKFEKQFQLFKNLKLQTIMIKQIQYDSIIEKDLTYISGLQWFQDQDITIQQYYRNFWLLVDQYFDFPSQQLLSYLSIEIDGLFPQNLNKNKKFDTDDYKQYSDLKITDESAHEEFRHFSDTSTSYVHDSDEYTLNNKRERLSQPIILLPFKEGSAKLHFESYKEVYLEQTLNFKHNELFTVIFNHPSCSQTNKNLGGILAIYILNQRQKLLDYEKEIEQKIITPACGQIFQIGITPSNKYNDLQDIIVDEYSKNQIYGNNNLEKEVNEKNCEDPQNQLQQDPPEQTILLKKLVYLDQYSFNFAINYQTVVSQYLYEQSSGVLKERDHHDDLDFNSVLNPIELELKVLTTYLNIQFEWLAQMKTQLNLKILQWQDQVTNYNNMKIESQVLEGLIKWQQIVKNLKMGMSQREKFDPQTYFQLVDEKGAGKKTLKQSGKSSQNRKLDLFDPDCSICFCSQFTDNNPVVYCSVCDVSFHQFCYGMNDIPSGKLLCDKCEEQDFIQKNFGKFKSALYDTQSIMCQLCPNDNLPLKRFFDQDNFTHWYHPSCLYINNLAKVSKSGIRMKREKSYHQKLDIQLNRMPNKSSRCFCCRQSMGIQFKCSVDECERFFHPMCAFLEGYQCSIESFEINALEIINDVTMENMLQYLDDMTMIIYCDSHKTKLERNSNEQIFYRRFGVNYKGMAEQYPSCAEFLQSRLKLEIGKIC